jgi:hypothetical protein
MVRLRPFILLVQEVQMDHEKMRVLARPFTDIKTRPGRNGGSFQYIEGAAVVQRLNEAFTGQWSFKVMEHQVLEGEVVVLGELRAGDLVKQAFGGSEVTRTREGKVVSIADDLKSACTDALKKAATLLGVGLHLYLPEEPVVSEPQGPKLVTAPREEVANGEEPDVPASNRLTRKQADFIAKLARQNGLSKPELEEQSRQRFGKQSAHLTVQQASDFIKALSSAA